VSSQGVQPVVNLPAGSVYATAVEDSATGRLALPRAAEARNVTLTFETGRVASIDADEGAEALEAMFDRHSGEPRRISHIGIGLNPRLRREYGWELVDEHRHGNIFIAFGENRYLGGRNASSLNVDFVLPGGTLLADEQAIVDGGSVVV
jgi:leucyl aminopeptidase (aminopeptidase T)